jgi:exodeoxyribonuclease V alpha subunit
MSTTEGAIPTQNVTQTLKYKYTQFAETIPKTPEKVFAEVTGKVVYVNPKNRSIFHIFAQNAGKKFKCTSKQIHFLKCGDVICGIAEYFENSNEHTFLFEDPPFCIQGRDIDTILDFFVNSLRGKGPSFSNKKATEFLKVLVSRAGSLDDAINMMDRLSVYLNYSSEESIDDLEIGTDNLHVPFSEILDAKSFSTLMTCWYKGRVLRNLYLLGMNNKEINGSKRNPLKLYEKCVENPYVITTLSLEKSDNILSRCGKVVDDKFRECGKIIRKISEMMENNGWTGVPTNMLIRMFPNIGEYLSMLRDEFGIIAEHHTIYLPYAHEVESSLAEWITSLLNSPPICVLSDISFTRDDLSEDQKTAIHSALNNNISIITGPGGSGKSHTIKELVHNLERNGISYRIGSFTGKAVARIRDIIDKKEPATLHMMIAMSKDKKKTDNNGFQVLILDESSMITTELLYEFRKRFTHPYRLVFVGDVNQLQPIGWGSLFESLIKSQQIPTTTLRTIHRTTNSSDNGILINSKRIIEHKDAEYEGPPFEFTITPNFKIIQGDLKVVQMLVETLNNNGVEPSKIVIVSPYNRDLDILNANSSTLYNSNNRFILDARGKKWSVNDRVMATENNYKNNVLTGDEGIIIDVSTEEETFSMIVVKFKTHTHKYFTCIVSENEEGGKELNTTSLVLSFACSVHRLQGSEADYVIGYIPQGSPGSTFLNSNLLYTLITRAKKIVWLVGDCETMERSATTKTAYRCENLVKRLTPVNLESSHSSESP